MSFAATRAEAEKDLESISDDDLCPVCQLLLYEPVKTGCNHVLCKSCMATWAEVSVSSQMIIVPVDEGSKDFDAATGLEAKCPMCRTQTRASIDETREAQLRTRCPRAYASRAVEEAQANDQGNVQGITLNIGNTHALETPAEGSPNTHRWTFFIRPSLPNIVEEVQIFLHPTFRPNRVIRARPPYSISRIGCRYFTINAAIILRAGYSWMSSDAEDSPDGAPNGMLRLDWTLDFGSFGGKGAMGRWRGKVKKDREGQWDKGMSSEEERDRAEWARTVRGYERDGRYEPPPED